MIDEIEERITEYSLYMKFYDYSDEVKEQVKKIIEEMEYLIFLLKQGGIK